LSTHYLSRLCPACGASSKLASKDVASEPTAEITDYAELIPAWNGFFKEKVFFSYDRCSSCGLLYAPTFFTSDQLEELYAQMPPNMDVVPIEALRKTQRGYFDALQQVSPPKGDYIEIGPDIGLFTENCVRDDRFEKYWLFEPNRDVAATLSSAMQGRPHAIIHGMFGFSQVPDKSAGTAVMIHVLDHLLDPVATLRELREKLLPNARLAIVTHDESSLLRRVFGKRWPAFCLQHPEIYNPKSIRRLLDTAGYDVVQLKKTVNYFPAQFLLRHLLWAVGLKVKRVPTFGGLTLGLKLGNMITIATPKAG
jgi:hypothetical protein